MSAVFIRRGARGTAKTGVSCQNPLHDHRGSNHKGKTYLVTCPTGYRCPSHEIVRSVGTGCVEIVCNTSVGTTVRS